MMVYYYYIGVYCFFMCFDYKVIFIYWAVAVKIVVVGVGD